MTTLFANSQASNFILRPVEELDIQEMRVHNVLTDNCPIDPHRLKILTISYVDFDRKEHHDGEMVVLDVVAPFVLNIFRELYLNKFPIHKMKLMSCYDGDDDKALADNNTSCFCDRKVVGEVDRKSIHSYGLAFDINPVQNPYISFNKQEGSAQYKPIEGVQYANRQKVRPNKPIRVGMAEEIVDICRKNGFTIWGGDWDQPIDYQHFQVPRSLAELLSIMFPEDASRFFEQHVRQSNFFSRMEEDTNGDPISLYTSDQNRFDALWNSFIE